MVPTKVPTQPFPKDTHKNKNSNNMLSTKLLAQNVRAFAVDACTGEVAVASSVCAGRPGRENPIIMRAFKVSETGQVSTRDLPRLRYATDTVVRMQFMVRGTGEILIQSNPRCLYFMESGATSRCADRADRTELIFKDVIYDMACAMDTVVVRTLHGMENLHVLRRRRWPHGTSAVWHRSRLSLRLPVHQSKVLSAMVFCDDEGRECLFYDDQCILRVCTENGKVLGKSLVFRPALSCHVIWATLITCKQYLCRDDHDDAHARLMWSPLRSPLQLCSVSINAGSVDGVVDIGADADSVDWDVGAASDSGGGASGNGSDRYLQDIVSVQYVPNVGILQLAVSFLGTHRDLILCYPSMSRLRRLWILAVVCR